jgi:hypothetical protein
LDDLKANGFGRRRMEEVMGGFGASGMGIGGVDGGMGLGGMGLGGMSGGTHNLIDELVN